MGALDIDQLLEISRLDDAEEKLTKLFDWRFEMAKLLLQAILTFLGAFGIALLIAFAREDLTSFPNVLVAAGAVCGVVGPAVAAMLVYRHLNSLGKEYVAALQILAALKAYGRQEESVQ